MPRDLLVEIQQNPSADYTRLPRQGGPKDPPPLDLVVSLRRHRDDSLQISAFRPGERTPRTRPNRADLDISGTKLLARAARLRTIWRDRLVRYAAVDDLGLPADYPFASTADVSHLAPVAENRVAELAEEGRYFLETMLDGTDRELTLFRAFLTRTLTEDGPLRVSFDSDLHLPWPMLAVDGGRADPWTDFLGHRHQVEQTGTAYPPIQPPYPARTRPVTSLNTDDTLELIGRAPEVRKLLEDRSRLTVRTESARLLEALSTAVLDEDVMYFWCHGQFVDNGSAYEQLAVRLSDDRHIDADLVRRHRRRHLDAPDALFRPFVLLNACHTGQSAAAELEHLGRALVDLGADGVLGPQIEIPQEFAAEYAFAFLDLYLTGEFTAGEITQALVRRFAREYCNPLALTYSLHCGIDSILELTP
ncbi:CHAT domain-containing protein [Kitasatospora aureofaciens]|uniref:CHAT domain-containing protein n=1 Tax=Kitasatospora aureofaciens TaxID=1894 RepID=UPI001C47AF3C|nr:CHAT domain-containing protein [Kitasatospora aureofaciens]MBV6700099.1 CHAT domain-containing protein [Kitasatospora aureofaciens]